MSYMRMYRYNKTAYEDVQISETAYEDAQISETACMRKQIYNV